jgi:hypothetical protein
MKDLRVSVFICAPMINPLNGKTVGPQRDHVKARAQLMPWGGKTAEIWVTDAYRDIDVGDVVADPHIWNKDAPEVVTTPLPADWFAVIGQQDSAEPTIALVRSNIGAASRQEEIEAVREINEPEPDAEPASMSMDTAQRNATREYKTSSSITIRKRAASSSIRLSKTSEPVWIFLTTVESARISFGPIRRNTPRSGRGLVKKWMSTRSRLARSVTKLAR